MQGIGYLGLAGIIKAGLKLGGKKMLALFGSQVLSQEVIAAVIEHGTDALVDHAISYASNEQEAVEFAETAVWAVEATLAGAAVVGVAGLIKDKAAVSSKLQATKINVSSTAKAKFAQKQTLHAESSQKITAVAKEKIAGASQKVSSFKPIREIPKDAPNSGVFHREVEFTYKKTGQTFKVTQRNDIDPNYVVTLKNGKQVTNRELMLEGKAPRTNSGAKVILHHMGQDAKGPLVEATEYSHLDVLHGQYGVNEPHPTNPVVRKKFDPIREEYWKAYGETFK